MVLDIRPAVADGTPLVALVKTVALGALKLARFAMLKPSARNCTVVSSLIDMFLTSDRSKVATPGSITVALPRFP